MVTITDKELLEDLRTSPRGQELVAERQEARLAQRKGWVSQLQRVTTAHGKEVPELAAAEDAALAKVRETEAALDAAQEDWRISAAARSNVRTRFDTARVRLGGAGVNGGMG